MNVRMVTGNFTSVQTEELACVICQSTLGIRVGSNNWCLLRNAVNMREDPIKVTIFGMKEDEVMGIEGYVHNIFGNLMSYVRLEQGEENFPDISNMNLPLPKIETSRKLLTKNALRGFSCKDLVTDIVILVHKCEGRLFLTDRNGFYNDFISNSYKKTNGNVLLILTNNMTATPENKVSNSDIVTLGTKGDQPSLLYMDECSDIFVWNKEPTKFQACALAEKILSSIYSSYSSINMKKYYNEGVLDEKFNLAYKKASLSSSQKKALEKKVSEASNLPPLRPATVTSSFIGTMFDEKIPTQNPGSRLRSQSANMGHRRESPDRRSKKQMKCRIL